MRVVRAGCRAGGLGQGQDAVQVFRDGAAGGGALGGVVAEHAGEFAVAPGTPGEVGDQVHADAGEQALQYGVPPGVGVEVACAVGAERGGDQPGVVGAQGVLDERERLRSGHQVGQGVQDGAAFVGGALEVDPGQGAGVGAGRVQDEDAGGLGVLGAAAAARLGEAQFPHRDRSVGAGVGGGLVHGLVEPGRRRRRAVPRGGGAGPRAG